MAAGPVTFTRRIPDENVVDSACRCTSALTAWRHRAERPTPTNRKPQPHIGKYILNPDLKPEG